MEENYAKQIRNLRKWNRFWFLILALVGLGLLGNRIWTQFDRQLIETSWVSGDLLILNPSFSHDKILITHLAYGPRDTEVLAALDKPILLSSSGANSCGRDEIKKEEIDKLKWTDDCGSPASRPPEGTKMRLIYCDVYDDY